MENPFSLTFGQIPAEIISRKNQLEQINSTFQMRTPSNHVFMIAGMRGTGKTVSLAEVSNQFPEKEWAVINLNPDRDLLRDANSELIRIGRNRRILSRRELSASFGIPNVGTVSVRNSVPDVPELSDSSTIRNLLDKYQKKNLRVLFVIDEIVDNDFVKIFSGEFQVWLREGRPVFLLMAGLYENIRDLQNERTLTFLYRAPKIMLQPLSIPAVSARYQAVFEISAEEADEMARLTKGYSFAFQILGYLKWEKRTALSSLLPDFDAMLSEYVYDKVWSELSPQDQTVAKIIADGKTRVKDIRETLGVSSQYMNVYRRRLIDQGLVDGSHRGVLTFVLPRFSNYIRRYC